MHAWILRLTGAFVFAGTLCCAAARPAQPDSGPSTFTSWAASDRETTPIELDHLWRYRAAADPPAENWMTPDYDDRAWPTGPALIGYDTAGRRDRWPAPGLQTEIASRTVNALFRTEFEYHGPTSGVTLHIDLVIDDAAVFYLNGREIGRTEGLPRGAIAFGTLATRNIGTPVLTEDALSFDDAPLVRGRNVLAVSVHNRSAGSSDLAFGLRARVRSALEVPSGLSLSWRRDPTTTMLIRWHGPPNDAEQMIEWGAAALNAPQASTNAGQHAMVFTDRTIHTAELTGLQPDTEYRFRIAHSDSRHTSPVYRFRTLPARADDPDRPLRLAIGGDVRHRRDWMERMNREAMRFSPDAIIWGGDLAYADGLERNLPRWEEFFDAMMETLIDDEGRITPVIMGIGNHEILNHFYWGGGRGRDAYRDTDEFRESIAPWFYNLFAFPGHPGYGVLDIGTCVSIIVLDTDHSGPVEGTQTEWLARKLAARTHVTHILPIYHVPAWPSVRDFTNAISARVRTHWVPLFEEFGVRVAFEHHDHAYKRTIPIRNGRPDPEGITYIGDGAWGVSVRATHDPAETWYLERAESVRHFILATISGDLLDLKAIDEEGRLIDHVIRRGRPSSK